MYVPEIVGVNVSFEELDIEGIETRIMSGQIL